MPIDRDLSGLPGPARAERTGWAPDPQPRFVSALAEEWMRKGLEEGPRPRAVPDKRFRHSDAGGCSRALAYAALDLPASNPMDITGWWATGMGSMIHDLLQPILKSRYGMEAEVVCIIDGFEGSGHADGELRTLRGEPAASHDGTEQVGLPHLIVTEYKTVGGYAYKLAVGEKGDPQGPSWPYVVQGALNALARNADELVIGLLARDVISVQAAARKRIPELTRFCAEWTLTREQFEPIARKEIDRVTKILALLDDGTLPARKIPSPEIPAGAHITDPNTGTWVVFQSLDGGEVTDAGTTWHCAYCRWQDTCATTSPYRTSVQEVSIG